MVDSNQLQSELAQYGSIILCEQHTDFSYVVVMSGVSDSNSVETTIDAHVSTDFPTHQSCTLVDGIFKCERTK